MVRAIFALIGENAEENNFLAAEERSIIASRPGKKSKMCTIPQLDNEVMNGASLDL